MSRLITELGYLGLEVSDLPRWERFANEVLGLQVSPGRSPDSRWLRMDERRYRFILTQGPADDCVFTGWQTAGVAALEAFAKRLDGRNIPWTWANDAELTVRAVQRMLHFSDPSGIRHEVYCGPALATDRFSSPKVASGFVTRGEGLGHVVYGSPTFDKSRAFVQEVLELSPSDQIRIELAPGVPFEVAFFHANSRHHSLALAPQPPVPGPHKHIHHFMIEVASVEDVGFARDRCLAMGLPVHMDIGQHPNDRMISFYGETPSGFLVEFGFGGVKVDVANWHVATYDRLSEWGHRPSGEVPFRIPAAAGSGQSASSAGNWNVTIKTPLGDNQVVFALQVAGDSVSGSIIGEKETNDIQDGKIAGNTLTWRSKVSRPVPMNLEFNATVDGNNISGGAKSAFGTARFSGTRG